MARKKRKNEKYSAALALALSEHRNEKNKILTITPGSYLWDLYQYLWDKDVVIMKSTQCGVTEWAIVSMLALAEFGLAHFYVMPTETDRNKLISGKLDKSIIYSPYYNERIRNAVDSKSMKIYAGTNLVFVGSNSESGFASVTSDIVTIDELDDCDSDNLPMAYERLSASDFRVVRKISKPTFEGVGISAEFAKTDQRKWHIKHSCGKWLVPDFFKHLIREDNTVIDPAYEPESEPRMICSHCEKPVNRYSSGEWVPEFPERSNAGLNISKLFSTNVTLSEILNRYKEGLENPTIMQSVYNGDLGLPYTAKGSKVSRELLDACIGHGDLEFTLSQSHKGPCVMGIDPGKKIHYIILHQNFTHERWDLVGLGWVRNRAEIDDLVNRYHIQMAVIDAGPELQLVDGLLQSYNGFWRCTYHTQRNEIKEKIEKTTKRITVNRTFEMDEVKSFIAKGIPRFPLGIASIDEGDFYAHMQAPIRYFDKDREDYVWSEGSARDDYYHAFVYALQAKKLWVYFNRMNSGTKEVRI